MTEQLPVVNQSHALDKSATRSGSLLGRGLSAIQNKKSDVASSDLDSRYRQARDIYNRITNYGDYREEIRFNPELLPTEQQLLEEPLLQELQPFYNQIRKLAEVFTVFQELANQGYGKAYFPLCLMYKSGQGVSKNIEKSEFYGKLTFNWCFANQLLPNLEIWTDLACLYKNGLGVDQDAHQAVFWYKKAAEQENSCAQYNLGWMYAGGRGGVKQDLEQAVFWHRKAVEQGLVYAQYILGWVYQYGSGVERDYDKAVFWYSKAAEQKYARAQNHLGWMYKANGRGVKQDNDQAVFWFRKAAEQGHADAQHNLGWMYANGRGVKQDDEQAVFWYRKATEQGHAGAQCNLGWMYEYGRGVKQDVKQAIFWYCQAAQQANNFAQENLTKLGINWQES